jgi:hypothetical protein
MRHLRSVIAAIRTPFTVICFLASLARATPGLAQTSQDQEPDTRRLFVSGEWHYGRPLRNTGGVALFVPTAPERCEDGICVARGVQIEGNVGAGGWRVGAGPAFGPLFGADVLLTAARTSAAPRGASPHSTYIGVEAGGTLLFVRPSVGIARRVTGPSGPDRTIVTWGLTVRVPLTWWFERLYR